MRRPGSRARAVALGVAAIALYLAGSGVSARLSVLARGPLLDGLAPPPPYRWVKPPPSLQGTNQPALPGSATVAFKDGRSQPGVFRTEDSQAVIVLLTGSIPPEPGQESVRLSITPLAPDTLPAPPSDLRIDGNVYRFAGTYEPSGSPVTGLEVPDEVVLIYPTPTTARHVLLFSADGKRWRTLTTHDSAVAQQAINENVTEFGWFAVARRTGSAGGSGGGRSILVIAIVAAALVTVGVVAYLEFRRRRGRGASSARQGGTGGRPPNRR